MRNSSSALGGAAHQTVAAPIQFKTGAKSIQIGFTNQRLSPHAGSALFWGWLTATSWIGTLRAALPHPLPTSNNHLLPLDKVLAFLHGLLSEARKLTHVACYDDCQVTGNADYISYSFLVVVSVSCRF